MIAAFPDRVVFGPAAILVFAALVTVSRAQPVGFDTDDDPAAAETRGLAHLSGEDVPYDVDLAIELLEAAAAHGRTTALLTLGDLYFNGRHVESDAELSLSYYRRAAELGAADGQYALGWFHYAANEFVARDLTEAEKWFRAAAHQQQPEAMFFLARMYGSGDGVERDPERGFELLRRAAELGSAQAAVVLAETQLQRDTDWFDPRAAEFWLVRWADNGFVPAQRQLGLRLLTGTVLARDLPRAASVLTAAAQQGDSYSGLWAAELLESGLGMPANPLGAALLRRTALESASASEINAVAWDLAVQPDELLRNGAAAVALMEPVVAQQENRRPALLDTLAAAYAEAGDFDAAVRTQREAIGLIPDAPEYAAMRDAFFERLRVFENGEAWHEEFR